MKTTEELLYEFIVETSHKTDPIKLGRQIGDAESLFILNQIIAKYAKLIDIDKKIILKLDDD